MNRKDLKKKKKPIVDKSIKSKTITILEYLNKIISIQESTYYEFITKSLTKMTPFKGSCLVYNVSNGYLQFWKPSIPLSEIETIKFTEYSDRGLNTFKENKFIYYPEGLAHIVIMDNLEWLRSLCSKKYNEDEIDQLCEKYSTSLYKKTKSEAEEEKRLINIISNVAKKGFVKEMPKALF